MPAFDMDKARVNTIKKLQKKLARYEKMEIEKMVEDKWDEATEKIASQLATALAENKKLKEENKNVLKENKKLKAQNEYLWEPVCADDYIRLQRQFDEIKRCLDNEAGHHRMYEKKCKKLKEELLFYRFYEHTIGQGDTLTKEEVDNFTDSQVDRKTLYDAIGYDEEEDFDPHQYGNCECCAIPLTEDDHENGKGKCEDCCEEE